MMIINDISQKSLDTLQIIEIQLKTSHAPVWEFQSKLQFWGSYMTCWVSLSSVSILSSHHWPWHLKFLLQKLEAIAWTSCGRLGLCFLRCLRNRCSFLPIYIHSLDSSGAWIHIFFTRSLPYFQLQGWLCIQAIYWLVRYLA